MAWGDERLARRLGVARLHENVGFAIERRSNHARGVSEGWSAAMARRRVLSMLVE